MEGLSITRYTSEGEAKETELGQLANERGSDELLWIDFTSDTCIPKVGEQLAIPEAVLATAFAPGSAPYVGVDQDYAWCRTAIAEHCGALKFEGIVLDIFTGPDFVLTRHPKKIAFIDALRARETGHSRLGRLGSLSFMGSLLHWVLDSYFDAVLRFEADLDRTEADILQDRHDEDSVRLAAMRKSAARLRRMLGAHRIVFSSLARPDFMPEAPDAANQLFNTLEQQFQVAMDAVEGTRELVIGTLEVLTNRIALRTNKSLRVLSFAAGIFGFMSVVVGAMGMNFQTRFFETADTGFYVTIGGMLAVAASIFALGSYRKWF